MQHQIHNSAWGELRPEGSSAPRLSHPNLMVSTEHRLTGHLPPSELSPSSALQTFYLVHVWRFTSLALRNNHTYLIVLV